MLEDTHLGGSSKGRTAGFGPVCGGSNPSPPANKYYILMKNTIITLFVSLFISISSALVWFSDSSEVSIYARKGVDYFVENGVLKGYPDGTFKPHKYINRAEMITIIARSKGINMPDNMDNTVFIDIGKDAWYRNYALWGHQNGYLKGYSDKTFRGDALINRSEMAVILQRVFSFDNATTTYKDIPSDAWYSSAVGGLQSIIDMPWKDNYSPHEYVKREEIASILYNLSMYPSMFSTKNERIDIHRTAYRPRVDISREGYNVQAKALTMSVLGNSTTPLTITHNEPFVSLGTVFITNNTDNNATILSLHMWLTTLQNTTLRPENIVLQLTGDDIGTREIEYVRGNSMIISGMQIKLKPSETKEIHVSLKLSDTAPKDIENTDIELSISNGDGYISTTTSSMQSVRIELEGTKMSTITAIKGNYNT